MIGWFGGTDPSSSAGSHVVVSRVASVAIGCTGVADGTDVDDWSGNGGHWGGALGAGVAEVPRRHDTAAPAQAANTKRNIVLRRAVVIDVICSTVVGISVGGVRTRTAQRVATPW